MLPIDMLVRYWACAKQHDRTAMNNMATLSQSATPYIPKSTASNSWWTGVPLIARPKYANAFFANCKVPEVEVEVDGVPVLMVFATDQWWEDLWVLRQAGLLPANMPRCELLNWLNRRVTIP